MIRDPSDGSIREKPETELPGAKPNSVSDGTNSVSGLPAGSTKPAQIARLNNSREWLKNYKSQKGQ